MGNINEVRQIMMNELGLTREYIREEARGLIQSTIGKEINRLLENGVIERMVKEELDRLTRETKWSNSGIRSFALESAKKQAEQFIKDNLRFEAKE